MTPKTTNLNPAAKKILIIEDNKDLEDLFKTAFEQRGFEVALSANGLEGITQAAKKKPDLILLDIMMPQMDGYEFLRALRENTKLKTTVVVNSNLEQEKDQQKALALGASFYFQKSKYTPFEIVEKVSGMLKKNKNCLPPESRLS